MVLPQPANIGHLCPIFHVHTNMCDVKVALKDSVKTEILFAESREQADKKGT